MMTLADLLKSVDVTIDELLEHELGKYKDGIVISAHFTGGAYEFNTTEIEITVTR